MDSQAEAHSDFRVAGASASAAGFRGSNSPPNGLSAEPLISRLLPELLTETFFQCVLLWETEPRSGLSIKNWLYPLVQITHVCRLWRSIALTNSALWSRITPYRSDCVQEWLRRSKQSPLTIQGGQYSTSSQDYVSSCRLILQQMSRIRSLQLHPCTSELQLLLGLCSEYLDRPAPELRDFSMTINSDGYQNRDFDALQWIPGNAPKLEELHLRVHQQFRWVNAQSLPWHLPATLKIVTIAGHFEASAMHDIMSAIEALPALEVLSLSIWPLTAFTERPLAEHVFTLSPSVKLVRLGQCSGIHRLSSRSHTLAACGYLLDHLAFSPASTALYIHSKLEMDFERRLAALAASLSSKLTSGSDNAGGSNQSLAPPLRSVGISSEFRDSAHLPEAHVHFRGWTSGACPSDWGSLRTSDEDVRSAAAGLDRLNLKFSASPVMTGAQSLAVLGSVCSVVPLEEVCMLYVRVGGLMSELPGEGLREAIRGMVRLRAVHADGWSLKNLVGFLSAPDNDVPRTMCATFPELRYIELENIQFTPVEMSGLAAGLRTRKSIGAGVETLRLRKCRCMDRELLAEVLGDAVEEIVWDA